MSIPMEANEREAFAKSGAYSLLELRELAEIPDAALAAAFRDMASRDYSKCWASLFRAHVIEKARASAAAPAAPGDGFRHCQFCGCHTNAKVRQCCQAGWRDDNWPAAAPVAVQATEQADSVHLARSSDLDPSQEAS